MVVTRLPFLSSWIRTDDPGAPVNDQLTLCATLRAQISPPFGAATFTPFVTGAVVVVVDVEVVDVEVVEVEVVEVEVVEVEVDVVVVEVETDPELGSTMSEDSLTASKSDPCRAVRLWRSLSFQRLSGAPLMNHELPLSATIAP